MELLKNTPQKWTLLWRWLAIAAVCVAYANSFSNEFEFDDFHTVVDNPAIRSLKNVPRFFTDTSTFSVLPANQTYRPFVSLSLAVDYAMGRGYKPLWFHVSTFVFFLGLLALLYLLYEQLLDNTQPSPSNQWIALIGAAWFGLHPAMAETVNYVIQRGDLYCTLGCVAALVVYMRFARLRKTGLYLLPLAFALLSKPPAAVFPVLLFFCVFFFEPMNGRNRWKTSAIAAIPSVIAVALLMGLQSAMTPKSYAPSILSAADYRLTQPFVWLRYFGEFFLPIHLNVDTDLGVFSSFDWRAMAGLIFLAALCVAIWVTVRRRILYPIAFGLIWFVVTQLPTSLYALSEVENDHRMFFSFAGLALAVVWSVWLLLQHLFSSEKLQQLRPLLVAVVLLCLGCYAWGVHLRNAVWHTQESLWRDDVEKSPHNGRGLMIYGLVQMNHGAYPEALALFERALQYTPNYATLEINLAVVHSQLNHAAEAEQHFQRAIMLTPADDTTHSFYGRWLLVQGRMQEAIAQLHEAIRLNPLRQMAYDLLLDAYSRTGDVEAVRRIAAETLKVIPEDVTAQSMLAHPPVMDATYWINLSQNQYRLGQYAQCIESARRALQIDPNSAAAYNNIGASSAAMGQWDDAVKNEREALRLQPGLEIAKNNLALFLQKKSPLNTQQPETQNTEATLLDRSLTLNRSGKFEESISAARSALKLNPKSAVAWNNIAANYEAMHRWDEAITAANKAIALQPDFQLAKNNLAWSLSQKQLEQAKKK